MDHLEAIRLNAAERYLLGELPGELREQYEDHFFSCSECAQDVAAAATFIDTSRTVLKAGIAPTPVDIPAQMAPRSWFSYFLRPAFALPALVFLLAITTYREAVTIPQLKAALSNASAPQALASFSLITANSRGAAPVKLAAPADRPFSIYIDIPPGGQFSAYVCDVETENGRPEFSLQISAEQAKNTVQLLIPPSRLAAGPHVLILRGIEGAREAGPAAAEITRYPFTFEFTK